ncbi:hypothetical protein [Streptomyces sp. NPDC002276]
MAAAGAGTAEAGKNPAAEAEGGEGPFDMTVAVPSANGTTDLAQLMKDARGWAVRADLLEGVGVPYSSGEAKDRWSLPCARKRAR